MLTLQFMMMSQELQTQRILPGHVWLLVETRNSHLQTIQK